MDTDSIRGTGTVDNILIDYKSGLTDGAGTDYCRDNVIVDVTVGDDIVVETNCDGNIVQGVTFSATGPQAVMTIATGADVTVPAGAGNGLTSAANNTITGAGDLYCAGSGTPVALPYTFGSGGAVCEY